MLSAVHVLRRLPLPGRWSTDPVIRNFYNLETRTTFHLLLGNSLTKSLAL